jgi:hypothetical protein
MSELPEVKMPLLTDSDVAKPTRNFLNNLNLLPTQEELKSAGGPGAVFGGPAQSVALIEAGGTALAKWWSAGAGAVILGAWGSVRVFWNSNPDVHGVMLWTASIVSAALVLAIGALLSSDVRGRAAAMVATVRARADIGRTMLEAAQKAGGVGAGAIEGSAHVVSLAGLSARNLAGEDSGGWLAIAMHDHAEVDKIQYLLVKGKDKSWVKSSDVDFAASPHLTTTTVLVVDPNE